MMSLIPAMVVTLSLWNSGVVQAQDDPGTVTRPRPANGKLVDKAPSNATVTVSLTGQDGRVLHVEDWPQTKKASPGKPAEFDIPMVAFDSLGDSHRVFDVRQTLKIQPTTSNFSPLALSQGAEISDLSLEAVYQDPTTHQYALDNTYGAIAAIRGTNVEVAVPDLFADTNHDGILGEGDYLYSLVDMNTYLQTPQQTFNFGDEFNIVNGQVTGLPGMLFSTTEFTFDPGTGFSGTPFTGAGTMEGVHLPTATPEPTSTLFLASGVLTSCGYAWRRRRKRAR